MFKSKERKKFDKYKKLIEKSGLFDSKFYLKTYRDARLASETPLDHFVKYGLKEDRKPNEWFDPKWYREYYEDIKNSKEIPFIHYCVYGQKEGRYTNQNFSIPNIVSGKKQKSLLSIVSIPRSGLTLFTGLMKACKTVKTLSLPFQVGRLVTPPSTFKELQHKLETNLSIVALTSSISDIEVFNKLKETSTNLTKDNTLVKYIWILRNYNSVYLSTKETAHRFWGAESININEKSYKEFFNFFFEGYKNIVEECLLYNHHLVSYTNLLEPFNIDINTILNVDCQIQDISYSDLKKDDIYGDPLFHEYNSIDTQRENKRKQEWKKYEHLSNALNEKQQNFVDFFNNFVEQVEKKEIKTLNDFLIKESKKLFDESFYLKQYDDVRQAQIDPWEHFMEFGWKEGRQPNKDFSTLWYKETISKSDKINPLLHYVAIGRFMDIQQGGAAIGKMGDLTIIDPEGYEITEDLLLEVPTFKQPKVSILIPAYNQQNYTMACIESIIKNTDGVSYEIIVMDDKSPDPEAHAIEAHLKNVKFVVNGVNYGFLRNCNKGAQFAVGEYILFLNNDTNAQPGWLSSLVELIESADDIGMVGSRLVYPTGQQQEAGGIVWKDASAWNYGRLDDPNKPEYNYVKEADYLTGAAMMIRRDLWEEIGGFDERYVPAYYEDTDIAFEVRKRGYRTLYQPRSVVIHFEGISNGTDTGSGIKRYQVINHDKFYEKWKEVLSRDHFPNAQHVFLARDRSRYKKHILFVDHYLPHYDQDAGSKAAYQYLKILAKSGMQVHFIGDNFYDYPGTPYLDALTQLGIEVLYGNWYANHWEEWLEENGVYLDYVMLSRPHIAPKYLEAVKRHTQAKIVYIGHDLHFLRERREYEIKGDAKYLESSEKWKEAEMALIRDVDSSWYFSEIEQQIVQKEDPSVSVNVVPLYIYEDFPERSYRAEERQDIMFIGGFDHAPNVDAVLWFVREIWPLFIVSNPGAHFYIIGSKPKPEILALAGDDITVTGFVSDEELEVFYDRCRMMVAPLRYGAGVKGKVIDALYHGMPLVTTSIGAEGIRGAEKIMAIEDDAESFAQTLNHLYNDPKALERMSATELNYCREHFSVTAAKKRMGKVIEEFREDS